MSLRLHEGGVDKQIEGGVNHGQMFCGDINSGYRQKITRVYTFKVVTNSNFLSIFKIASGEQDTKTGPTKVKILAQNIKH